MPRPPAKVVPRNLGVAGLLDHFERGRDTRTSLAKACDMHLSRLRRIVGGSTPTLWEACVLQDRAGVHYRAWLEATRPFSGRGPGGPRRASRK